MNIAEQQAIKRQMDVLIALIQSYSVQLDRLEQRIAELEQRPRPGRPPKITEIA